MPSPDRLFHAIVVLGAALSGCGGKTDRSHDDDRRGGSGDGGVADAAGPHDAGSECVGPAQRAEECATTADFFCENCLPSGRKCHCEAGAPVGPAACEKPQDFHCQSYSPMTGCRCVTGSPAADSDCDGGTFLSCFGDDPPIACDCITVITAK